MALERRGLIEYWPPEMTQLGPVLKSEFETRLNKASIVVALVSADFLNSDSLHSRMQRVLARHFAGELQLVTVLIRPVELSGSVFDEFSVLPRNRPVTQWKNQDAAWVYIARKIRRAVTMQRRKDQARIALRL